MSNTKGQEVTIDLARNVLNIVDAGLCSGIGQPAPGQMCVEAAVCYAMGLPHSDKPTCVSTSVRSFKIHINDKAWSSKAARAKGLRRIAIAQLGSAGVVNDERFSMLLAEKTIRVIVPLALRSAAKALPSHAGSFEKHAAECEQQGTKEASYAACAAADAAYAAYAADSASYAACAAAAAAYAAYAADSASYAACAAAAAACAADSAARAADERDRILTLSCELAIDVLRELGSPGIAFMDELCPKEGEAQ